MVSPSPAQTSLGRLIAAGIDADLFPTAIKRLHNRFNTYAATCPAPYIAPGLIVTPEIRRQSELYLPVAEITGIFNRLYRHALTYPPVLSSTPFHSALSWADVFVSLPPRFQFSTNPARLMEALLSDQDLLTEFLFASFLPRRFYGGFSRYPGQMAYIRKWIGTRRKDGNMGRVRCLDAACGAGEDSYGLANLLMAAGLAPEEIQIGGWTLEPLEVWAAAQRSFPHDRQREAAFRRETSLLLERGYRSSLSFRCADLTKIPINPSDTLPPLERGGAGGSKQVKILPNVSPYDVGLFDLILCNGLLGGPIIHEIEKLEQVVGNLARLLAPGGILVAADSFHGGWKSKCGNDDLKELFSCVELKIDDAGEGVCGLKC